MYCFHVFVNFSFTSLRAQMCFKIYSKYNNNIYDIGNMTVWSPGEQDYQVREDLLMINYNLDYCTKKTSPSN